MIIWGVAIKGLTIRGGIVKRVTFGGVAIKGCKHHGIRAVSIEDVPLLAV